MLKEKMVVQSNFKGWKIDPFFIVGKVFIKEALLSISMMWQDKCSVPPNVYIHEHEGYSWWALFYYPFDQYNVVTLMQVLMASRMCSHQKKGCLTFLKGWCSFDLSGWSGETSSQADSMSGLMLSILLTRVHVAGV